MSKSIATASTMTSSADSVATKDRVRELHRKSRARTPEEELARRLVPKLAARSYHLPGYSWRRDWMQYMCNNHPVVGLCCHHRLHPMKWRPRLIILLGSFAYGVAITNAIYLWFLGSGRDDEAEVFAVDLSLQQSQQSYSVTSGLLVLLTVGSGSHAVFDRFVWTMSACRCCRAGGRCETRACCKDLGSYLVIFLVTLVFALATFIVVIRASMEEEETSIPLLQNWTKEELEQVLDFDEYKLEDYSFLRGYAVEFAVSLGLYYPFFETILFCGFLGCFRLPVLGGRPAAMKREAKRQSEGRSQCPSQLA